MNGDCPSILIRFNDDAFNNRVSSCCLLLSIPIIDGIVVGDVVIEKFSVHKGLIINKNHMANWKFGKQNSYV